MDLSAPAIQKDLIFSLFLEYVDSNMNNVIEVAAVMIHFIGLIMDAAQSLLFSMKLHF